MNRFLKIFIPVFIITAVFFSYVTPFIEKSEKISEEVFRLHILANSDSDQDQALKLKVRDSVLEQSSHIFSGCTSIDEVIERCNSNIDFLKEISQEVIYQNGYDYPVNVYIDREYFNTRKYNKVTLPSGFYNALKIEIGEAKGHNWWCVMFPAICLPSVSEEQLSSILSDEEMELINSDSKYEIRFKIVELYEKLKK